MKFKDGEIYLDIHELSREIFTSINTIKTWRNRGKIKELKIDGRYYYNIDQFPSINRSEIISEIIKNLSKNI